MKTLTPVLATIIAVALAMIIGPHLTDEAAAVLVGLMVGVAASVPTCVLLMVLLRNERALKQPPPREEPPPQLAPPTVMIIHPERPALPQPEHNTRYIRIVE